MKTATINLPFAATFTENRDGFAYLPDVDGVSAYGPESRARARLREALADRVQLALQAYENGTRGWVVGCANGEVLLLSFRFGSWGYVHCGPEHSYGSGGTCGFETLESAVESAKRHAEAAYGGVIWDHRS